MSDTVWKCLECGLRFGTANEGRQHTIENPAHDVVERAYTGQEVTVDPRWVPGESDNG